ncbi:Signal transduction histidine kinase [Halomicrobium zhouii]|uniref:Signal transduction histidine kinase n=1 Tax=Halomicrobium zhouii TaxID=767519 RepID=A0A1I6L111_9EURY|nr:HAMP domain-containing sensor histidine kinase [Halomicrobium zhouii]SFR97145.1 Signal transduction histidine kinase [Halomicrobium zhouii]
MKGKYWENQTSETLLATIISASGFLLLLWSILEPVVLFTSGSSTIFQARYIVGHVTIVPSCLGLIWGGQWLRTSEIPVEHHRRIGLYWILGGVGFLVFNIGLMTFFPTDSLWVVTNWIRWALTLGLAVGLVLGISHSRSIFTTLTAERQTLRAEHMAKQRDLVDQMNGILRHEVLNSTQVIVGNASLLRESDEPIEPTDERLQRILRQGEEVTTVIQEVRSLLSTIQADRQLEPVNLSQSIRAEIAKTEERHPGVSVAADVSDDIYIEADEVFGRILSNLLGNAVQHNNLSGLVLTVDAEVRDESVRVVIQDNGGGIPEDELETLFSRPDIGDHGLGLHLVKELTLSYGGTIDLIETGEAGTTFELRFPVSKPHHE